MLATPENVRFVAQGLDHPESVAVGDDGALFAGGEAGQIYRIAPGGNVTQLAHPGGFILGVALDAIGNVYACDCAGGRVLKVNPTGAVTVLSTGTQDAPMRVPNHPAFDRHGNLFVSDSDDYWHPQGTGRIYRITPDGRTDLFHAGPFRFANGIAVDPSGRWLYVAQSSAGNIVRIPLDRPNGVIEISHRLPPHTVPDGLVCLSDGKLLIACYRPDHVLIGTPDGNADVLIEDLTAELLNRPTNVAVHDDTLYVANLGGQHIAAVKLNLPPAVVHRPRTGS